MSDEIDTKQGYAEATAEEQGMLTFPCTLGIKAMGRQAEDFQNKVTAIITGHVGEESIIEVRCRESSGGKYHSVSCEVKLESRDQMEAIYQTMHDHPDILMTL